MVRLDRENRFFISHRDVRLVTFHNKSQSIIRYLLIRQIKHEQDRCKFSSPTLHLNHFVQTVTHESQTFRSISKNDEQRNGINDIKIGGHNQQP